MCRVSFFNKVASLRPATLRKDSDTCFPVNFANKSKNTFFTEQVWATASD